MKIVRAAMVAMTVLLGACGEASRPPPVPPAPAKPARTSFRIADAASARALLGEADGFTRTLGAFDRSLRLKTTAPVDDDTYRRFAAEQALDFTPEEQRAWLAAAEDLSRGMDGLDLGLPPVVLLVKTTGQEEFDAAYTRGNAIVLPARLRASDLMLAHELFHVSSRLAPALRSARYALLGFRPLPKAIAVPPDLEARRVTNPDAYALDHFVVVKTKDGEEIAVVPLLTCDLPLDGAIAATSWFSALRIKLVVVGRETGVVIRTVDARDTDWSARLERNTSYAIHPEEVLADNFALLVKRRSGAWVEARDSSFLDELEKQLRRR